VPTADLSDRPPKGAAAAGIGDPRRALGRLGEDLAAAHLSRLGYEVIARNVRTRHGEIDLIAVMDGALVFAEVKSARRRGGARRGGSRVAPLEWLDPRQRARLRRLAAAWLADPARALPATRTIRFDAIGVIVDERDRLLSLEHLESAW
jgi:putative endonuclease